MPETTQVIRIESRKAVTSGAVRAGRRRGTMRDPAQPRAHARRAVALAPRLGPLLARRLPDAAARQIEAKALRKLKHPSRSRKLRSFLDN
jgi:hypothetical protein